MTLTATKMKGITIKSGGTVLARPTSLHAAAIAMRRKLEYWLEQDFSPKVWIKDLAPTESHIDKLPENLREFLR